MTSTRVFQAAFFWRDARAPSLWFNPSPFYRPLFRQRYLPAREPHSNCWDLFANSIRPLRLGVKLSASAADANSKSMVGTKVPGNCIWKSLTNCRQWNSCLKEALPPRKDSGAWPKVDSARSSLGSNWSVQVKAAECLILVFSSFFSVFLLTFCCKIK